MRAAEYDRAARNLREFLEAFDYLFSVLHPVRPAFSSPGFPQWVPKAGMETQAELAAAKVTRLAGPAAEALQASGCYLDFKPAGTWQGKQVNPILVWSTMLSDSAMLDPQLMSVVAGQGLGLLEHWRDEQAERERGVVGAIAWFFTLAPRVREAAGLPSRSARGAVITGVVATFQAVLIGAAGGALALPVAHLFGWA